MNRSKLNIPQLGLLAVTLFGTTLAAAAQEPNPTSVPAPSGAVVTQDGNVFFYKVNVVKRDIDAVNYLHRSASTKLDFVGTSLLPDAKGKAEVKSERGKITVDAEFRGLTPANGFGPEYLTYVLWAISPDGRPVNLGEVLPAGTKNNISVSVPIQAFGLIVTAEPYYAVTTPSDVVVLKNVFTDQTNGVLEKVNAHATLYPRGLYAATTDGANTVANPITRDERSPLELYQAYNAVRIAKATGADKYSPEIFAKATQNLENAAAIDSNKKRNGQQKSLEISLARGAVLSAADARIDTLRKQAAERQRNAELAQAAAQAQAASSQQQAQQAELQSERDRLAAESARLSAQQAQIAKTTADANAAQARTRELEANQRAASANERASDAEKKREELRARLNAVLQTTETPRGIVVNLSDVLFDTGKYNLKDSTKLALARIAGILQIYPGLKIQVEGYTDAVGSDALNQKLSENRASTTKDFLISQGVSIDNISAAGYGKADPVADNSTAAGRAQNRRVNLVVSGEAIGVAQSAPTAN